MNIFMSFFNMNTSIFRSITTFMFIRNYSITISTSSMCRNSIFCIIGVGSFYFLIALFTKRPLGVISKNIAESMDLQSQLSKETKSGFRIIEIDNLKKIF